MASGVDTRSRGSVFVTESHALVLKAAALRIGRTGQCIMKERPLQKVEAGCGAASAAQGFAPLRRR
jgi:hypothetical protein